jgi:hypothetical protein
VHSVAAWQVKSLVPWYGRVGAKLILSRLPVPYSAWRNAGIFRHGGMNQCRYAFEVFREHLVRSALQKSRGFVMLELGPGDSLLSAVLAAAHGASRSYLVDVGAFATRKISPYQQMADFLESRGISLPPQVRVSQDVDTLLQACNATYRTEGINSLRGIPTASVDFIWSQAVLEHIRRGQFPILLRELRRVLRSTGVSSHRVDLKDHLGGRLDNLRIPTRYWEADWMAKSGFYTNRIRFSEMIGLFRDAGFSVEITRTARWEKLPTRKAVMATEFRGFQDDDLLVQGFDVLLRPVG